MKKEKYLSLYRIGKFYNAYNDDGIILHELLEYKYVEYKKSVGFPESALNKVRNKLEENHISYKIYEKEEIKEIYKGHKDAYEKCFSLALKNLDMEKRINHARSIIDKCTTEDLTNAINVNVPVEVKEEATSLFNSLGLNMSTAINMFLKRAIYERGIPFEVKQQPSKEFAEALKELDYMEKHSEEYKTFHSVEELMEDLNKVKIFLKWNTLLNCWHVVKK